MKLILKKNKASNSLSYSLSNNFFLLNKKFIKNFLKDKILKKKIARVCLHKSKNEKLQQMIILQKKNYAHPPKKHIKKIKYYMLVSGTQIIKIFNSKKKIIKSIELNKNNFICRIPKNTWHGNMTTSKESFHIEFTEGPFDRIKDNIYL